jgi:hypothetical protein
MSTMEEIEDIGKQGDNQKELPKPKKTFRPKASETTTASNKSDYELACELAVLLYEKGVVGQSRRMARSRL